MRFKIFATVTILSIGMFLLTGAIPSDSAAEDLRFSCSAQIYQAMGDEVFNAFTKKTGLEVDIYLCSSNTAMERLTNDYADLASSTKKLYYRHQDYGYSEIVFGKDPMVLITNEKVKVNSLSKNQIQDIFSGRIKNWIQVGGDDHIIVTMVPGQHTGAYWNFRTMFMEGKDIRYDFMSYKSNMVIKSATYYPYVISFVTRAAIHDYKQLKVLNIDGISPDDPEYPYFISFAFITKGNPAGAPKAFIDFVTQGEGKNMLKKRGINLTSQDQ